MQKPLHREALIAGLRPSPLRVIVPSSRDSGVIVSKPPSSTDPISPGAACVPGIAIRRRGRERVRPCQPASSPDGRRSNRSAAAVALADADAELPFERPIARWKRAELESRPQSRHVGRVRPRHRSSTRLWSDAGGDGRVISDVSRSGCGEFPVPRSESPAASGATASGLGRHQLNERKS